jgi:NAD(P)-dependent dehydrogenase (short-subunit alcohol dehydrogenase family)
LSVRRFEGKVAIITGGGGGIGSAAGEIFCREGAKVAHAVAGVRRGLLRDRGHLQNRRRPPGNMKLVTANCRLACEMSGVTVSFYRVQGTVNADDASTKSNTMTIKPWR